MLEPNRWPIYEGYNVGGDEIEAIGSATRFFDLGDENQHLSALRDWLSVKNIDDLNTFLSLHGYPLKAVFRDPLRKGYQFRPRSEAPISSQRLLSTAEDWRYIWNLMVLARKGSDRLTRLVVLLLCDLIPGQPFEQVSYFDGDHEDGKTVYDLEQAQVSEEDLLSLGRANFQKIQNGINPFPAQYDQLVEAHDAAEKLYRRKFRVNRNERKPVHGISPETVTLYFLSDDATFGRLWDRRLVRKQVVEDWLYDWRHELARVALEFVAGWLTRQLSNISPQVSVMIEDAEPQIKPLWNIATPMDAMALAFYKEATQSSLLEICPHPTCGKIFVKTRRDRLSCGSSKCQQYMTIQNRMLRYKAKREI